MNVVGKISVNMKPVNQIIKEKGLTRGGDVQRYHTANVMRRIARYLPYRSGMLIKLMQAHTDVNVPLIVVQAPQARYLYYGKVMVNSKTGKGPMNIPGVGLRYPKGATLVETERALDYDTTKNPLAGPFWDRRLVANEMGAMQHDLQDYVNRKAAKR